MKKIYTFAIVLAAVLFAAIPANADRKDNANVYTSKTVKENPDKGTYTLTLETYVTGGSSSSVQRKAADIVLVLDTSNSMNTKDYPSKEMQNAGNIGLNLKMVNGSNYYYKWTDGEMYKIIGFAPAPPDDTYAYRCWLYFEVGDTRYYLYGDKVIEAKDKTDPTYNGKDGQRPKDKDDNVIAETKGSSTTIWTGEVYIPLKITRLEALKNAVCNFLDVVNQDAVENGVKHRVSIVEFANSRWPDNDEDYPNTLYEYYSYSTTVSSNWTSVVKRFTEADTEANVSILKEAVDKLQAISCTSSDYGMQLACNLFDQFGRSDAAQTVVMFTDGVPTRQTAFNPTVANDAIKYAKSLKDSGAKIFTVGVFESTGDDVLGYMNAVSSNYPNATAYNQLGEGYDQGYYQDASDGNLSDIFEVIAGEATGGADVELTATSSAVVLDILTNYFKLPAGTATDASKIKVYTSGIDIEKSDDPAGSDPAPAFSGRVEWKPWTLEEYTDARDETGKLIYDTNGNGSVDINDFILINRSVRGITVQDKDKDYLEVTGYDFACHYVGVDSNTDVSGTETRTWHEDGQKLIIEFDIVKDPANTGGADIPTNALGSGIYGKNDDGKYNIVEEYERPIAHLPYLRITKEGLKEGESAMFYVVGKCGDASLDIDATVILTQDGSGNAPYTLIKILDDGEYTVSEVTGWSWSYGEVYHSTDGSDWKSGDTLKQTLRHEGAWTSDNCYLDFYFKNGDRTDVKHDESTVNNNFGTGTVSGRDVK